MSLLVGFLRRCWAVFVGCRCLLALVAVDLLELGFVQAGQGVPEVEKGVLLVADVHEHRLEAGFDVLDAALEDAADDVAVADALDGVFLQDTVLQEGNAAFELFDVDEQKVVGPLLGEPEHPFNFFDHGLKMGI